MFDELTIIINEVLSKHDNIIEEIATKASQYVNPKDIQKNIKQIKEKLDQIDLEISRILDKGMLLISRGVQDEGSLKEHLGIQYSEKRN